MAIDVCLMESREERCDTDTSPPQGRSRGGRGSVRGLRIPLLVSVGLVAVFFTLQARLIFPGSETQGKPSAVVHPRPDEQLVNLTTAHGDRVVVLFSPALTPEGRPHSQAASCPTLLYFYGNAMCLNDTPEPLRPLPTARSERAGPGIRRLWHEWRQGERGRLPGYRRRCV